MQALLAVCVFVFGGQEVVRAYPFFQTQIPNGNRIPHSCDRTKTWPGVGHEHVEGQGPLNPFGRAFLSHGTTWSIDLCKLDSDGDGKTNGEELGDPNCKWQAGMPYPNTSYLSHPGVCEPITDPKCRASNKFLSSIDICAKALNVSNTPWCPAINDPSVKTFDMRYHKIMLPANDTTYLCQQYLLPADRDYHVIGWEPLIDNHELMHHAVIFGCITPKDEDALNQSGLYHSPEECPMTPDYCQNMVFVWSYGQENRCYSNEVGVLFGNSSIRYLIMQIHYNNPFLHENLADSSGFRLYYTPKIRQYNAGMLNVGQLDFIIPPGAPYVSVKATAFPVKGCSERTLINQTHHLTSVLFHMHHLGNHAKLVLKKASGKRITLIDETVTYDRPKFLVWSIENSPTVEPGDDFEIECVFGAMGKTEYTFFGERTSDEMCIAFMEMFPPAKAPHFFDFFNNLDMNSCLWNAQPNPLVSPVVNDCVLYELIGRLSSLNASTEEGSFMANCIPEHGYPATVCTPKCAKFLKANNFTASDPCMSDAIFRYFTMGSQFPSFKETYTVQSQVNVCFDEEINAQFQAS